jgi:hypothetical protein
LERPPAPHLEAKADRLKAGGLNPVMEKHRVRTPQTPQTRLRPTVRFSVVENAVGRAHLLNAKEVGEGMLA